MRRPSPARCFMQRAKPTAPRTLIRVRAPPKAEDHGRPRDHAKQNRPLGAGNGSSMRSSAFRADGYRTRRPEQRSSTTCRKRAEHIQRARHRQYNSFAANSAGHRAFFTAGAGMTEPGSPAAPTHLRQPPSSAPRAGNPVDRLLWLLPGPAKADRGRRPFPTAGFAPPAEPARAPVAQLDRAPDYEFGGREFESLRARHIAPIQNKTGHHVGYATS